MFFAGQICGVEGYVESIATGLMAGIHAAALAAGVDPVLPAAADRFRFAGALRDPRRRQEFPAGEHHFRSAATPRTPRFATARKDTGDSASWR